LLRIPQGAQRTAPRRTRRFALAGIGLAAAAIAAIAAIALFPPTPRRDATRQAHEQAVEEFGVAMAYLRQSVTVASDQSASAVRGALAADGRAAQDRSEPGNGD
jgi:hypothetical protein